MNNTTFWSRICKVFGGSDKNEENSSELSAEEMKKFREAVYDYDVRTVISMIESGYDVNAFFYDVRTDTVDGQYTIEYCHRAYTILDVVGEPMKSLLRAYGGKTYAELYEEENLKRLAQEKLAKAQRDAEEVERMRVIEEKKKQAESEVAAILAKLRK